MTDRGSDYSPADILAGLWERKYQLWVVWEKYLLTATITETFYRSNDLVCSVLMCAGPGTLTWLHHLETIEEWAASKGCDYMEIVGRRGWGRVLDYQEAGRKGPNYIYRKVLR